MGLAANAGISVQCPQDIVCCQATLRFDKVVKAEKQVSNKKDNCFSAFIVSNPLNRPSLRDPGKPSLRPSANRYLRILPECLIRLLHPRGFAKSKSQLWFVARLCEEAMG